MKRSWKNRDWLELQRETGIRSPIDEYIRHHSEIRRPQSRLEGRTIKVDASSISGAIGKATREFVKSLDRKQRFDMNKGLKIEALRVTTDKTEASAAEASA